MSEWEPSPDKIWCPHPHLPEHSFPFKPRWTMGIRNFPTLVSGGLCFRKCFWNFIFWHWVVIVMEVGAHSHNNWMDGKIQISSASQKTWHSTLVMYKAGPWLQFLAYVPPSACEDRCFPRAAYPIKKGGLIPCRIRRINCPLKPEGAYTNNITCCLIWRRLENLGTTSSSHLLDGILRSRFS